MPISVGQYIEALMSRDGLSQSDLAREIGVLRQLLNYVICGGTALAMQIGHRQSENLDFMVCRISKTEEPEVDWRAIKILLFLVVMLEES